MKSAAEELEGRAGERVQLAPERLGGEIARPFQGRDAVGGLGERLVVGDDLGDRIARHSSAATQRPKRSIAERMSGSEAANESRRKPGRPKALPCTTATPNCSSNSSAKRSSVATGSPRNLRPTTRGASGKRQKAPSGSCAPEPSHFLRSSTRRWGPRSNCRR